MDRLAALTGDDLEAAARFRAEQYATGVDHPLCGTTPTPGVWRSTWGYWMDHIVGMHPHESDALLRFVDDHVTQPRFQCRWRWAVDDLVVWDERRTMHLASTTSPDRASMRRCTVIGEVPLAAPAGAAPTAR